MSKSKSLVVLQDSPHPAGQNKRLHVLVILALIWLAALSAHSLLRDGAPPSVAAPAINIGPVVISEPGTEIPLPIKLGPAEKIPKGSWLQIDGLPVLAALSEGHVTRPGTWVVPLSGLAALKLRTPPTKGAKWEIAISLMSPDGLVVTEARSVLVAIPTAHDSVPCPSVQAAPPASEVAAEPASSWIWPGAKRDAKSVVLWGDDAVSRGSIGAARNIYNYAATQMGWPTAALALAATYDPHELVHLAPLVKPDPKEARLWYMRAQELSNARINFYLQRLEQPKARGSAPPPKAWVAGR